MKMERIKNTQKNRELERHKAPVFTPIRDNPAPGRVAVIDKRRRIRRTVRLFEGAIQEHRERMYITRALSGVPRGTSVLNWPCGCSRLLPLLKKLGYNVTSADSSSDAVGRIRLYGGLLGEDCVGDQDDFHVINIFLTGFENNRFGAAVVNQLCCLPDPQIRQLILTELRRICCGPIVVSFFCNTMIYENSFCQKLKSHEPETKHLLGPSRKNFEEEVRKSGLIIKRWVPRFALHKRQLCAVLVRDKGNEELTSKLEP
jgi:hypothetical protein